MELLFKIIFVILPLSLIGLKFIAWLFRLNLAIKIYWVTLPNMPFKKGFLEKWGIFTTPIYMTTGLVIIIPIIIPIIATIVSIVLKIALLISHNI